MPKWADYLKFVQDMTGRAKSANGQSNDEKLKQLFDYSKEVFDEDRNIFRDLENKASKYLTVFTALLAAAGFFANWLGIKVLSPKDWLETALLVNGLTLILVIFVTWLIIFLVLKIGNFEELPLDQGTIDFFLHKPLHQVYQEVSIGLKDAIEKNAETRATKAKLLKWGHWLIIATWVLLLLFTILFVAYKGRTAETVHEKKTDSIWQGLTAVQPHSLSTKLDIMNREIYSCGTKVPDKNPNAKGAALCLKMGNRIRKQAG